VRTFSKRHCNETNIHDEREREDRGNNKRNGKTERTRRLRKMVKGRTRGGEKYTRKARANSTDFQCRIDKHKKGWRGWRIENRNDKIEEMKELSQPKSEEVIASIQQEEDINILTRWVPKINSEGKKKPVTRLKKGEHTRYLGAWLANGIDDKEQIRRLDRIIKEVVHRINITRSSYAVCRYVAQAKIGGTANYVMRFTNISDDQLQKWDKHIWAALMRKAIPPNGIDANGTQLVQTEKWGPRAISLQAMYKAIQIEGTFELLNTQTIQAQWFKAIYCIRCTQRQEDTKKTIYTSRYSEK